MGIILAAGLVLVGAGCETGNNDQGNTEPENQNSAVEQTENTNAENAKVDPGVTKEDLNQLKVDLEGMQYDDLNTLTK